MDFFGSQEAARKKTKMLVFLFLVAVVLIMLSIYAAFSGIFLYVHVQEAQRTASSSAPVLWHPSVFLAVCGCTLAIILSGSLIKMARLRGGGSAVAASLGGVPIPPDTHSFEEKRILNIVEEMAIASGIPIPPVYVLPEKGINAFAAGYAPDDAVIGVTQGMLEHLKREEQQGVIAHEFSHILNGDMRMNIRLMGIIHGILAISIIGEILMRSLRYSRISSNNKKGGGAAAVFMFGLVIFIIGYVGVFFGKLIKSAVSRQREFLADASAVQFTRNPQGLAGALKSIGGLVAGSRIQNTHAEEASHMFFGNGVKARWFSMLATHPPLAERIRILDPQFDGVFQPIVTPRKDDQVNENKKDKKKKDAMPDLPVPIPGLPEAMKFPVLAGIAGHPETIQNLVGAPHHEHIEAAGRLLEHLPPSLQKAARNPTGARAVIYSLLLNKDPDIQKTQWQVLEESALPETCSQVKEHYPLAAMLPRQERLPLAELAVSGLRQLDRESYGHFRDIAQRLVEADQEIDLFEYTLNHLLTRQLDSMFNEVKNAAPAYYSLERLGTECSSILSLLARLGQEDPGSAEEAFQHATSHLDMKAGELQFLGAEACGLDQVDASLKTLAQLTPKLKKGLITACFACITHDGKVVPDEAELFRAFALALDCPVPPWLGYD